VTIHSPDRPPLPPFSFDEAVRKVRMAEDAWNTRDPAKVVLAYTPDTRWRNRDTFLKGRTEVEAFLKAKWERENGYRLIKEIWAHDGARIAVRFCYEWHDAAGEWFRAHGNENWEFSRSGHMAVRHASINDVPIRDEDRLFHWPHGPRPPDHPGLSDLWL
jgi:nuclear transport factor 2 (NTF2) superfamily protein